MSPPETCARCGRNHGCGPQPWGRIPKWVRLCDECMADRERTPLTTDERIILSMWRLPLTDGPGPIARFAGLAESTVRRHLPTMTAVRAVDRYGWWVLTSEGQQRAARIAGVDERMAA